MENSPLAWKEEEEIRGGGDGTKDLDVRFAPSMLIGSRVGINNPQD